MDRRLAANNQTLAYPHGIRAHCVQGLGVKAQGEYDRQGVHDRNDGQAGTNARAARTKDKPNNRTTTDQFTALFHCRFTNRAPSISRSFNSSCKNTIAAGSMIPASTCTHRMISCSGAPGINVIPAAAAVHTAYAE